jgi:hypothetical protein
MSSSPNPGAIGASSSCRRSSDRRPPSGGTPAARGHAGERSSERVRTSDPTTRGGGSMLGWVGDIERTTLENETYRTVIHTGEHTQLTVMRLAPGRGHRPRGAPPPRPVPQDRVGDRAGGVRPQRGRSRRDARCRGRLGDHRPRGRVAQRGEHRRPRPEALLALRSA